jgi:uncharacterized protein (DUF2345 family)
VAHDAHGLRPGTDANCTDFTAQATATLMIASPAGASNIKVSSVEGFSAGQKVLVDSGANLEDAVIVTVGTAGLQRPAWEQSFCMPKM